MVFKFSLYRNDPAFTFVRFHTQIDDIEMSRTVVASDSTPQADSAAEDSALPSSAETESVPGYSANARSLRYSGPTLHTTISPKDEATSSSPQMSSIGSFKSIMSTISSAFHADSSDKLNYNRLKTSTSSRSLAPFPSSNSLTENFDNPIFRKFNADNHEEQPVSNDQTHTENCENL